jgi:hypothetical protein
MKLADETAHRALAYVAAVTKQGHAMTVEEFDAFVKAPHRTRRSSALLEALAQTVEKSALAFTGPKEEVLPWLQRLGWLRSDLDRVLITPLGLAVLAALEEQERVEELPTEIVLDRDDELSYPRVIGAIADAGEAALIDPYFSIESLLDIIQRTRVQRLLTMRDPHKPGRLSALAQAVNDLVKSDRPFEVRASDRFHDRFVIAANGEVRFLGTSLGGVGKRLSVTAQLSAGPAADAIRTTFETVWRDAEPIAAASVEPEPEDQSA